MNTVREEASDNSLSRVLSLAASDIRELGAAHPRYGISLRPLKPLEVNDPSSGNAEEESRSPALVRLRSCGLLLRGGWYSWLDTAVALVFTGGC